MTVAAWDGRILASDRQASVGEITIRTTKLYLYPEHGVACVCAGSAGRGREFLAWVEHGRDPEAFPEWQRDEDLAVHALLIDRGRAYIYSVGVVPIQIDGPFHAIGTGAEVAMGAMAHGANAIEAVEIANRLCPTCGDGVDWAQCVPDPKRPKMRHFQMAGDGTITSYIA